VAPSIIWGIGVGLIIAAVDAAAIFLIGTLPANEWPIDEIDLLINIALFSLIGFRVGRATGLVRDAAEAGVLASVLVSAVALAMSRVYPSPLAPADPTIQIVQLFAQNIVLGGVLAIVGGWFGSKGQQTGRPSGRR